MGMSLGGGGGRGKKPQPQPNVNVTPLVDIALVVLIIFMVVTPLMTKEFWLNLPLKPDENEPPPPPPKKEQKQPLVMTVDSKGTIRINKVVLTKEQVPERLPRMLAAQRQKVLFFDAADDVDYGTAVAAMDAARMGGARSIAVLTEKVAR